MLLGGHGGFRMGGGHGHHLTHMPPISGSDGETMLHFGPKPGDFGGCHSMPAFAAPRRSRTVPHSPRPSISIQRRCRNGHFSCQFSFIIMPRSLLNSLLSFFCTVDLHC